MSRPRWESGYEEGGRPGPGRRPFPLPGDTPHYPPDRPYLMRHLRLEVSFDLPARTLLGRATLTVAPVNDGLTALELDAAEMEIGAVALGDGRPLEYRYADPVLWVRLGRPYSAGEEIALVVDYRATPRKGLYFTGPDQGYPDKPWQVWTQGEDEDSHYWFPCHDTPSQRLTSEVVVTVPSGWWAVSNGRLVSLREDPGAGTRTFHWSQERPHAVYLVTLAAGEFSRLTEQVDGLPLEYYVPPGREEDARRALGNTPAMLRFFQQALGTPFPWAKYAQVCVQDFIFGGMENTSATTLTDLTLHDERAHQDYDSDPLVAHELAHMWFGDLVTCRDWAHAWLNEGFATYMEALWTEHHKGADEFKYEMFRNREAYLREDAQRYRRPIVCNVYHTPTDLFDRHLYEKGALVLHMLRFLLGDALFWKAVRHYLRRFSDGSVTTPDLQRAVEEATGRNLDWFFDQWVYKGGHPELKASLEWDEGARQARLTLSQTQETDDLTPLFRMPMEVAFVTTGGRHTFRVEFSGREHQFTFPLPERPLMTALDPGGWLLKALELSLPTDMLLYQLRHDEDPIGRIEAARALARVGTRAAVDALRDSLLSDPFWGVRAEVARALGDVRTPQAREALLEALREPHPRARRAVVRALANFKQEEVARALERVLAEDPSYYVAAEAARALGATRWPGAYDALVKALERPSHRDVIRAMAFEGLAELREERALPLVKEWTAYGRPPQAREGAVSALGKLGRDRPEVVDLLVELLEDPWLHVRLRAVDALEELREERAIPALERRARADPDGRVVRRAREAVMAIRQGKTPPEEVRRLREDLERTSEEARRLRDRLERLERLLEERG